MSDLVTRLRRFPAELCQEAARRIEALENWAQLHRGDTLSLSNEVEQ